jgi:PhnB protein
MADRPLLEQLDQTIDLILAGAWTVPGGDPELAALAGIAGWLRHLPAEGAKVFIKTEMERRTSMTASAMTKVPAGFRTVTPFIIHERAPEMVEFMKTVFQAEEVKRTEDAESYGFYSEVRIGDTVIMIGGGAAARRGNLPSALHVYVPDTDAAYRRAVDAGARTLVGATGEPADRPYGERSAFVEDPFGNYWYIATRLLGRPAPPQGVSSVMPHLHPESAREEAEFLKRAFDAQEMEFIEHGGRVMHAAMRIGDAVVEMGEADDRSGIPSNGLFVFVEDVEAAFAKALAAGATAVRPPDEIPYGMRSAIVRDPSGYLWWPAKWTR